MLQSRFTVFELQLTWPCDSQASVLLALQTLDAKYREPLLSELVSMSQELRHGDTFFHVFHTQLR